MAGHNGTTDRPDVGEDSPLLQNGATPSTPEASASGDTYSRRNFIHAALLIVLVAIFEFASALQQAPQIQVFESVICRNLGVPAASCGENIEVQSELALLTGWLLPLAVLPGLLTAVPYGFLADKHGRKLTLLLCVVGLVLSVAWVVVIAWFSDIFPLRLIWVGPIFTFFGGGPVVLNALIFAMLADLAPEAHRANFFFALGAVVLGGDIFASPLASRLMQTDPWIPIFLGLVLFLPAVLLAAVLPETMRIAHVPEDALRDDDETQGEAARNGLQLHVRDALARLKKAAVVFIGGDKRVALLLALLLVSTFGKGEQDLLMQFARKKHAWTWAQAAYLTSIKSFTGLVLLVALLPGVSFLLTNYAKVPATTKDFRLAQASCVLMLAGSLTIGLSESSAVMIVGLVLYVLGAAYGLLLRSLLAAVVEPQHRGALFNAAGMVDSTGLVLSGPLLAQAYRVGLGMGGVWVGLPFLVGSSLFLFVLIVLFTVKLPEPPKSRT